MGCCLRKVSFLHIQINIRFLCICQPQECSDLARERGHTQWDPKIISRQEKYSQVYFHVFKNLIETGKLAVTEIHC